MRTNLRIPWKSPIPEQLGAQDTQQLKDKLMVNRLSMSERAMKHISMITLIWAEAVNVSERENSFLHGHAPNRGQCAGSRISKT